MFDNLKQNIPTIQIFTSYLLYIILLVCSTLPVAVLWIIFNIYIWLLFSMVYKTYNIRSFIYVLCSAGVAISISLFFIQGVEELPFPQGALMFNIENIMKSSLLFFISTIPLIIMNFNGVAKQLTPINNLEGVDEHRPNESAWEEATEQDLESGDYEAL